MAIAVLVTHHIIGIHKLVLLAYVAANGRLPPGTPRGRPKRARTRLREWAAPPSRAAAPPEPQPASFRFLMISSWIAAGTRR